MLSGLFEELCMKKYEMIELFKGKLRDIVNQAYQLGESFDEEKLVRKILKSLPERFRAKVTEVDEPKDVSIMKFDELIGSLHAYEMTLPTTKLDNGIAFLVNVVEQEVNLI